MNFYKLFTFYLLFPLIPLFVESNRPPNIVLMIADDMGWNDVGFHGNNAVKTPNIDSLAYNGIILNRHYVLPSCTPSRTALLTGKYPIRTGLQGYPLGAAEPTALPLDNILLPGYLQQLGYKTHLVGKWHLGYHKPIYTPTERGFDSFFGYYNGWITYNNATNEMAHYVGYDARRNLSPAKEEFVGKYVTDVFTNEAVKIIQSHDRRNPLFLEISHTAVHAIRGDVVQANDQPEKVNEKFHQIENAHRRFYASALESLDESVGTVITALHEKNLLNDCVILFMSDNGGATTDLVWHFTNYASNWPLRGMKMSVTEGGVRGTAVIWSSYFKTARVADQFIHITDWLPTLYTAAGGKENLDHLDGVNQWSSLIAENSLSTTVREEFLINIDEITGESAYIYKNWKLIRNKPEKVFEFADDYAGAIEWSGQYNVSDVITSKIDHILRQYRLNNNRTSEELGRIYTELRSLAKVNCALNNSNNDNNNNDKDGIDDCFHSECLFDIIDDPCERINRANHRQDVVDIVRSKIDSFYPQIRKQEKNAPDERADPKYRGGYWGPWMSDY